MPIVTPTSPPNPNDRINALRTPKTNSFIDNFFKNGGRANNIYNSDHSYYVPEPLKNNISAPGVINININDATILTNANPEGIPYVNSYDSILLHELGHAYYATRVATDYTSDPAKVMEWCFNREALASLYVFNVLIERGITDGSLIVPGPGIPIDLYSVLLSAVAGVDPRSNAYESKIIAAARARYAASPKYKAYCTNFIKKGGLPPGYYPPEIPGQGGGSPGGTVPMPVPYVPKIPGGYWRPVPNEDN